MAAFGFKFSVDGSANPDLAAAFQGRLTEVVEARQTALAVAFQGAAVQVAGKDKRILRDDVIAGGFYRGAALSKVWRVAAQPGHAPTLEPAVWISTGRKNTPSAILAAEILEAFSDGVTITAHGGRFLAIPQGPAKAIVHRLNQAGNRTRGAFGGSKFEAEAGAVERVATELGVRLVAHINSATGKGVLVGESKLRVTQRGRVAKRQRGEGTVLFVLVRQATLKKRIQGVHLLDQLKASFEADFAAALLTTLPDDAKP